MLEELISPTKSQAMKLSFLRKWRTGISTTSCFSYHRSPPPQRSFRSDAALEAIARAAEDRVSTVALYNYPSFAGAFSALFARLFHSRLGVPCLVLPFSSAVPLRIDDLCIESLERLYLLDSVGPQGFAEEISRRSSCEVIGFDHRKSVVSNVPSEEGCPEKLEFRVNVDKSSAVSVYEYFSAKLSEMEHSNASLLDPEDRDRVETVLKYIEDVDLRRQSLPDVRAFSVELGKWRLKLNCLTNQYIYEQLLEMSATDLIAKGNYDISLRDKTAEKLSDNVFRVRLGRGLYGECLGVRADKNPDLADEIGKKLSVRSAAAGLRPIGAVVYMQCTNLKMCLRSTDGRTDTSEVAKAYGGGGSLSSSSFIIRMDEYNEWLSHKKKKKNI